MALLLELYLGHLIGDFVLQPGWLVAAKRDKVWGLLVHVVLIGLCTAIILGGALIELWNIVLLAMAAHMVIEVVTVRIRATNRVSGLSVFLFDQGLHIVSLVALVAIGSQLVDIDTTDGMALAMGVPALALACAIVAVGFMGAIVGHETVNALGPISKRRVLLPFDTQRVLGMLERVSALLLAVLVDPVFMLAAFVPRTVYMWRRSADDRAYHMIIAATGLVVAAAGWLFVAMLTLASVGN
ncbi:MAG: DUF3307 domain-containing protein [Coriobacteriia bacterium]|nr:DUF3307 domain-containing protein [Coriobacteriia bacterium]MDO9108852.1 DUF3307 domain-containing protein [Coriobacteriia bacterium]